MRETSCFIATASYGSELSDEVQFLRGVRENKLKKHNLGSKFLYIFEKIYYSFSPTIAKMISPHYFLKQITRVLVADPFVSLILFSVGLFSNPSYNICNDDGDYVAFMLGIILRGLGSITFIIGINVLFIRLISSVIYQVNNTNAIYTYGIILFGLVALYCGNELHQKINFNLARMV